MSIIVPIISESGEQSTIELPDPTVASTVGQTFNIGEDSVRPGLDTGNGNTLIAQSAQLTQAGFLQSMSFYVNTASGTLRMGVYDTNGDKPGNLVATTAEFTPTSGWNTVPMQEVVELQPGQYWLAYFPSSSDLSFAIEWSTGQIRHRYVYTPFGEMPASFPGSTLSGTQYWSLYATLSTTAVAPPPPPPPPPPGGLPALWNASPPAGKCPAPSGPFIGPASEFDSGILAQNEIWDHFDGTTLDNRLWLKDTINQGGQQVYDPARTFLDGNGNVVFEATRQGANRYRSGRLTSRTKFNMQYGWLAARMKFPDDPGFFPAWWLLFVGYNRNPYAEIDMIEFFGRATRYETHLHFGSTNPLAAAKTVPASHGGNASNDFHTYWMLWEPDRIQIGVDDLVIGTWTEQSVGARWANMQQPMYYIWNFAVHPEWLPAPAASAFPARMLTDWIWYKPLDQL